MHKECRCKNLGGLGTPKGKYPKIRTLGKKFRKEIAPKIENQELLTYGGQLKPWNIMSLLNPVQKQNPFGQHFSWGESGQLDKGGQRRGNKQINVYRRQIEKQIILQLTHSSGKSCRGTHFKSQMVKQMERPISWSIHSGFFPRMYILRSPC